jgi:hypothetical protein
MLVNQKPVRKSYFLLHAEVDILISGRPSLDTPVEEMFKRYDVWDILCIWDWDRSSRDEAERQAVCTYLNKVLTSSYQTISISSSPYLIPTVSITPV